MSFEEKRLWVFGVVSLMTYGAYTAVMLNRLGHTPAADVAYGAALLWAIGGTIVVAIIGTILVSLGNPREAGHKDERDQHIHHAGETVGYTVFSIGILGVLVLAVMRVEHFWIGNAVYLAFMLAALSATAVKLGSYHLDRAGPC